MPDLFTLSAFEVFALCLLVLCLFTAALGLALAVVAWLAGKAATIVRKLL
jgi:hypothetical protein